MSWLSTLQTAKRLGVSEASVRRWSDRGLLPVQRVGKRLERRFKAEHVDRFVAPAPAGPPPRSDRPRVTVAGQVVDVPTHLATLYDTDAARTRLTAPFLADGIRAGQAAFLMAHGEDLASYMESVDAMPGIDLDADLRSVPVHTRAGPPSDAGVPPDRLGE